MQKGVLTIILGLVFICRGICAPCNLPVVGAINGPNNVCTNSIIILTDTTLNGIWLSSDTSIARVDSIGVVTGMTAGVDTITYSVTNVCGTTAVLFSINVIALPVMNPVSNQVVCAGSATTAINFNASLPGTTYRWSNSEPSIGLAASGTGSISSFTAVNNGTSPVVATITATPVSPGTGNAYVPNFGSGNVSVINTATNTVTATIDVGNSPYGAALNPDASEVYITNYEGGSVSVISTATNTVIATIEIGGTPIGAAVTPDGSKVYVTNEGATTVTVINAGTNTVADTIELDAPSDGVLVSPDGNTVYVTEYEEPGYVWAINTATNIATTILSGESYPGGLAISPDGSTLYIASGGYNDSLLVYDIATNTVTAEILVQSRPYGVVISQDGSTVYVANNSSNTVSVINTVTNTVNAIVDVGGGPVGMSISPDGSEVYVANEDAFGTVSVINTATNTVSNTITVGSDPYSFGNFISRRYGCTGEPVTFTITVNPTAVANIAKSICTGQSYLGYDSTGIYVDTLYGAATDGCDSILTLSLRVSSGLNDSVSASAAPSIFCPGDSALVCATPGFSYYSWSNADTSNCFYTSNPGTYSVTVTDTGGCTAVSNQVITSVYSSPSVSITQTGDTLSSYYAASYQWEFNGQPLTGDTFSMLITHNTGIYVVEITDSNGCQFQSPAVNYVNAGISDLNPAYGIQLYPNPNAGNFIVEFTDDVEREIEITDAVGNVILPPVKVQKQKNFNFSQLASAIYFLYIHQDNEARSLKFTVLPVNSR